MCGHPLLQAKNVKVKDIKLNQLEKWYGISGIQHRDGIQRLKRFFFGLVQYSALDHKQPCIDDM